MFNTFSHNYSINKLLFKMRFVTAFLALFIVYCIAYNLDLIFFSHKLADFTIPIFSSPFSFFISKIVMLLTLFINTDLRSQNTPLAVVNTQAYLGRWYQVFLFVVNFNMWICLDYFCAVLRFPTFQNFVSKQYFAFVSIFSRLSQHLNLNSHRR